MTPKFTPFLSESWVFLLCVLLVTANTSCERAAVTPSISPSTSDAARTESSSTSVNAPKHARRFTTWMEGSVTLVEVHQPWQGSGDRFRYVLVPEGAEIPNNLAKASIVHVPVKRIVAMSTTYLPALGMLNSVESLVGVSRFEDVSSPEIRKRIDEKKLVEVGAVTNVNQESLLELEPDLVWTYGVADGDLAKYEPIVRSGIPVVIAGDYMEETPLGRAEWIKFFALFLGKEKEADEIFRGIESRYLALRDRAKAAAKMPTVMLESSYQGTWYVPGGRSYVARLLEDAGANYLWASDTTQGSLRLSLEAVLDRASRADYWLNTGRWKTVDDALAEDPRYWNFQPLRTGHTYNHNAKENEKLANDFFESGPTRPDLVLADMIKIFHPELVPVHKLIWYQQLAPSQSPPK